MSDVPSAGTARPDAAPSREFEYLLNAMEQAGQSSFPAQHGYGAKRKAVLDYVAALRSALAEREADTARLDWLEARLLSDPDFEITGQPDLRWPRFVLTNHPDSAGVQCHTLREAIDAAKLRWADPASAAVAPAARETQETNDG